MRDFNNFESLEGDEHAAGEFQPARFEVNLALPAGDQGLLKDAAWAIRQEYRDSSKWKRLRCRQVDVIAERERGTVVALHVGGSIEFDWRWEGAIAFRPTFFNEHEHDSGRRIEELACAT